MTALRMILMLCPVIFLRMSQKVWRQESGSETSEKSFQNLQVRVHDEDNILYENK